MHPGSRRRAVQRPHVYATPAFGSRRPAGWRHRRAPRCRRVSISAGSCSRCSARSSSNGGEPEHGRAAAASQPWRVHLSWRLPLPCSSSSNACLAAVGTAVEQRERQQHVIDETGRNQAAAHPHGSGQAACSGRPQAQKRSPACLPPAPQPLRHQPCHSLATQHAVPAPQPQQPDMNAAGAHLVHGARPQCKLD